MTKKLYIIVICCLSLILVSHLIQTNQRPSASLPSPNSDVSQTIRLRAVGDIMIGRSVAIQTVKKGDWRWPFMDIIPELSPVDIFIGNLEFPIVDNCPLKEGGMVFCAPPESPIGLTYAGFNLLSLANNHSGNYGAQGLAQTIDSLNQNHIVPLVDYQTTTLTINDVPIGFLALHDLYQPIDMVKVTALIQDLKTKTSVVVVIPHWGIEYETTASNRQKQLAATMIDAGASIIVGSHPHVVQPIESTDTTIIAYSLGNFVFDQMWSTATRQGIILDLDLEFTNLSLTRITSTTHPFTIFEYGQPRLNSK